MRINKKINYMIAILFIVVILSPYSFSIDINSVNLKKIESLKADNNTFSFAVMGDNRDGENVLKKIIQSINSDKNIKFAINNGDLVPDGYKNEFKKYISVIKTSKKPIINIIGNHEIPWYDGERNYKAFFGKTYFSFIFANSYFIILDDSNEKGIDKKQKSWLMDELKKSQNYQNRFVLMHVPLFDPRKGEYKKGHSLKNIKTAQMLNDLFDRYNVTMLFCSHIHFYYRGFWHKTPFIITGGAGAPLKHYKSSGFYHYIKVIVNGKNVQYKVVRIKAKPLGFFKKTMKYIKDALGLD
jgi:hypothetical protein